jgi:hypothetical protein
MRPATLADIPKIIKMQLNPRTKIKVLNSVVFKLDEEFCKSFTDMPLIKDMKDGNKGKMQGLIKVIIPAVKEAKREMFKTSIKCLFSNPAARENSFYIRQSKRL